ncbi:hypothetical protein PT974_07649 [Cladobotryum mycophilum]|uniref:ubiquitinyl hydrolase 1 n=1 Tax=Cladobotryum mycophilum TaxID=491253 RepID=A0ABR0SR58_9HYPO
MISISIPNLSRREIQYIVEHIVLPPMLPQSGDDPYGASNESALLETILNALEAFRSNVGKNDKIAIDTAIGMIQRLRAVRDVDGFATELSLQDALKDFEKNGGLLPIHVKAQNAGIIMTRENDSIIFEPFELSAKSEMVMSTLGRLKRSFPASSVALKISIFSDEDFQIALASTISKMSRQEVAAMKPKVMKAGDQHIEERDTTSPDVVTDFLASVLSSMGEIVYRRQIWKNTREEVLWSDAKSPWRRSPLWLLVRVTLQTFFARSAINESLYKEFMVFLMAYTLQASEKHNLPNDIVYCMIAKASRRLLKLDEDQPYSWLPLVEKILSTHRNIIGTRWEGIIQVSEPALDIHPVSLDEIEQGKNALYLELDRFLESINARKVVRLGKTFKPRWTLPKNDKNILPNLGNASGEDPESIPFHLAAFEDWVAKNLNAWVLSKIIEEDTCEKIYNSVRAYHCLAAAHYSGNPERLSVMLLTTMELWVAGDKSALAHHELMLDYDPEIPLQLLQSLILPFKDQMERLSLIEKYGADRLARAKSGKPPILSSFGHDMSFSVRYFASSPIHQILKQKIEDEARSERQEKIKEFNQLKAEHTELMRLHDASSCTYVEIVDRRSGRPRRVHSHYCKKCNYLSTAERLCIEVHEWPLPERETAARSTVFELQVPKPFNAWRDLTTFCKIDVFKSLYHKSQKDPTKWTLENYLSSFYGLKKRRITLVSSTKPNGKTHRNSKLIGTAEVDDVLVTNGMTYDYFDDEEYCFLSNQRPKVTDEIPQICTYRLSKQCLSLQEFVFRPPHKANGLSPNEVISRQANCPDHLSLEEFKAMATIPVGFHLQWLNILTNLHIPSVDFKKLDTVLILLQATRQAGLPMAASVYRSGHRQLRDEEFVHKFIQGLSLSLDRIKENWESFPALTAFISLATRLLSLSPSLVVSKECLVFLENCRHIALNWLHDLQSKIHESDADEQRRELFLRLFQIAHVCAGSFYVDYGHLQEILKCPKEACTLIESSIIIQTNLLSSLRSEDTFHRNQMQVWHQFMYKCYPLLLEEIVQCNSSCLDDAILKTWSSYPGGSGWASLSTTANHWITTQTQTTNDSVSQTICFNLVTAELLVDGIPLSRLPSEYEKDSSYQALFGRAMVEVMPTNLPGMQFSSKEPYHGCNVFFGKGDEDNNEILFVAIHDKHQKPLQHTLDFIPPRVFDQMLPHSFVYDYVHWYNRETDSIEFRPKSTPWKTSEDNWVMRKYGSSWSIQKDCGSLLNPACVVVKRLSKLFAPFEEDGHIHVTYLASGSRVEIELPRLQLSFWVGLMSEEIYCHQYRGMYIDPLQRLGTLVGLESKLVLRCKGNKRKVLLPNGRVQWEGTTKHIRVSISYGTSERVYPYNVDELLGQLVDNGNLQSKLILCYLHALTAHCLPDPLTGNTGTEQSLSILNSAAVRSFECLSQDNIDVFQQIARLSPKRSYYPKSEQVMEQIVWNDGLSSLCQHLGFCRSIKSILEQAALTRFFYPGIYIQPDTLNFVDSRLEERQSSRASTFQVYGFGAENHTHMNDKQYPGRGIMLSSPESIRAYTVSKSVYERQQATYEEVPSTFVDVVYNYLKSSHTVGGGSELPSNGFISYDAKLLGNHKALISSHWCQIHAALCSGQSKLNRTQILLFLAVIAYSESCDAQVIQTIIAFANLPAMESVDIPQADSYELTEGRKVDTNRIKEVVGDLSIEFVESPDSNIPQRYGETTSGLETRRYNSFQENRTIALNTLADSLQSQWICESPRFVSDHTVDTYLQMSSVTNEVRSMWKSWYQNHQFYNYLVRIYNSLRKHPVNWIYIPKPHFKIEELSVSPRSQTFISEQQLFEDFALSTFDLPATNEFDGGNALLERLKAQASRPHEKKYVDDLARSFNFLTEKDLRYSITYLESDLVDILRQNLKHCQVASDNIYEALKTPVRPNLAMGRTQVSSRTVTAMFMAPRISPKLFLRQLANERWQNMPGKWKRAIVAYGLSLSNLQRARRMLDLAEGRGDILKELLNAGHTNWDPYYHPKSLLLEIESDILIRENQADIAAKMSQPPNGANAVMQLNMGEGKSSVIVPIVAAQLANGTKLVRIIVAKPQAKELYQTLVAKLGGLLNHRIYHLPFSRSLKLAEGDARVVYEIHRQCMAKGGILLVQPEQILSLQLMGVECMSSEREQIGRILLDTQQFLDDNTRDIVDESDENFSTKFELIYTMGDQRPIEFSPERWILIQKVLGILAKVAPAVKQQLPESIEVNHHADGCFPRTRILRQDALSLLMKDLAQEICKTGLPGFPIARQTSDLIRDVLTYISNDELSLSQIAAVEHSVTFYTEATEGPLLLLRGLIAEGLLAFAFGQKRWRVNYGLAPSRRPSTRLAVPYRAKDCPSPRSEFSHVDIVIILTCLSYYYGGLSDDDLFLAFEHLMKSDQADGEYDDWVRGAPKLPNSFHRLIGVNLKDRYQAVETVFPHFRFSKSVIDYFLAHIVFPKEMREFPQKLSASGWDIGQQKTHPTTGFSGTNDSRHLLPLDMKQLDLEDQLHTNALVLEQLLRSENTVKLFTRQQGGVSDAQILLNLVGSMDSSVQVILDVGAQILELTNYQVAKAWLQMVPLGEKEAVVFFNDFDDLCVVDRRGHVEHLQTSPYSQQLDRCLVFLDESHTRGTDLKLPRDYRAAVTLGANLTKDRLVQACMRMRNLGRGQSVVFCVSEEIESKIRLFTESTAEDELTVSDVLLWSISETYADLRRNMPLWATQGARFERQSAIWAQGTGGCQISSHQANLLLEDDIQSLEHRYRPRATQTANNLLPSTHSPALLEIERRCKEFDCLDDKRASLQEEQERELSPEVVQERQVQRPHPAEPEAHHVHPHVASFIDSGSIPASSPAFIPAFQILKTTSTAESFNLEDFPSDLLATIDYMRTVKLSGNNPQSDSYQRPVQWILSSTKEEQLAHRLIIISPFEAQELMLKIEKSSFVSLHLYAPRPNLAFPTLDTLDLYTVPAHQQTWQLPDSTRLLLNIFAGQLYFQSFKDYQETCEMLGLAWQAAPKDVVVGADGFISRGPKNPRQVVTKSPVKFLTILFTKIRRDCESIDKAHWGRILSGEMLTESGFVQGREMTVVLRPKI